MSVLSAFSLRSQILAFTVALVTATLVAVLVMVLLRSDDAIRDSVNRSVEDASESLSRVISYRQNQLASSAGVLVSDFGFKQAVATGDAGTVESMLNNHGQRIAADVMFILDLRGQVQVSTSDDIAAGDAFAYSDIVERAVQGREYADFLLLNGHLYQMVLVPLRTPRISAIAGIGFRVRADRIREVLPEDNIHVTFISRESDGQKIILSTITDPQEARAAIESPSNLETLLSLPFSEPEPYLTRRILAGDLLSHNMDVMISDDLSGFYQSYEQIRNQILLLAAVFILMAVFGSSLIARRLTRPLAQLANATRGFASGNFGLSSVIRSTNREVSRLLKAFALMSEELNEREEKIIYQATHDSLTGALNRDAVTHLIENMVQQNTAFLLIGVQISGLKSINENFGIETGDRYLQTFADRLRDNSNQDYLARQSADEFAMIIPTADDCSESARDMIVNAITGRLSQPMQIEGIGFNPDFYTAVLSYPEQAGDARQVWRRFSIALEHAITHNQRFYIYEDGLDQEHIRKTRILHDLKATLADNRGQLRLYYQPKLDLSTGKITKAEALIRWIHPELGFIPPDYFIALAEQTRLIKSLTRWVFQQVLKDQEVFSENRIKLQLSVNISASDLVDDELKQHVQAMMDIYNFQPQMICLEITERDMMTDVDRSISLLNHYRHSGFKISVDDYGIGYSALSKLSILPVDELKIDKSFVLNLDTREQDQVIVKSTIAMAHELGMQVVAEGVENSQTLDWLGTHGCDLAQGYFISKALPVSEFISWFHSQQQADSWISHSV